jgi:hypothetical protein
VELQLGFMLIALIWKFDFSPFMILVIAILNDGGFGHSNSIYMPNMPMSHQPLNRLTRSSACLNKFRHNHDDLQGQSEAIATPGQLEAERDLHHRHRVRHLHGRDDRGVLLCHD